MGLLYGPLATCQGSRSENRLGGITTLSTFCATGNLNSSPSYYTDSDSPSVHRWIARPFGSARPGSKAALRLFDAKSRHGWIGELNANASIGRYPVCRPNPPGVRREPFTRDLALGYIGSRGLNAKLLWEMMAPGADPLGPDNPLIFGTGPMTGTFAPCSGRISVTCKSPATGFYLKTNVGGGSGGPFRFTGYGTLVLTGASRDPVYLWIDDERVEFRDARHLWGKDVRTVDNIIKSELGDPNIRVATIGPGGENQVVFASIITSNYNAAGRGGAGAVMGSKKLKAIAVRGTKSVEVVDPDAFEAVVGETWNKLKEQSGARGLHLYGTAGGVMSSNALHRFSTKNFQIGYFENAYDVSGHCLVDKGYLKRRVACYSCVLGCHRYAEIGDGKEMTAYTRGPEYENFGALGAGTYVSDTDAVTGVS